jgi:hypothetical protein
VPSILLPLQMPRGAMGLRTPNIPSFRPEKRSNPFRIRTSRKVSGETRFHAHRPIAVLGTRCQNYHRGGNSSAPPGV